MRTLIAAFFILVIANVFAQKVPNVVLNGKVIANSNDLEGIYVVNLKNEKSVITEKEGFFTIEANPGDTLMFSSMQFKGIQICLEPSDFQKELFFVKMEQMINQLPEVLVRRYDNINAVSLGIVPAGIKHYSPAERKYATASSGAMNPMGLDPLFNLLSGRTAMLKKEIEVEKKEFYLQKLDDMFDKHHFVDILKIPAEYIKGFEYYIVENDRFTSSLNSKNNTMTEFLMTQLATKYNEIIACENE
ncbi:hypothetical protein [Flavobacterium sp.]|uniref:hypothetical protein n=1 Tax=Flavobacterium sp. TaxID=239 RepID=UPI003796F2F7